MREQKTGFVFGLGAYALWGFFPLFFGLVAVVDPLELVPWRVAATMLFCVVLVAVTRGFRRVWKILGSVRLLLWFTLSGVLLYLNWQVFVWGVMHERVIETSLGYFINPLLTIVLGVFVRGERLSRLQFVAVAVSTVGVVVAAVAYGEFPWIALALGLTFAFYGAVHKHVGPVASGITGLTVETVVVLPFAAVQLLFLAGAQGLNAFSHGAHVSWLVVLSGVVTAVPLVFFGEAATRLPLIYMGFIQFLTPVLSFLYGFFVLGEVVSVGRWFGFCAVWCAIVILLGDAVRVSRRARLQGPATGQIMLQ